MTFSDIYLALGVEEPPAYSLREQDAALRFVADNPSNVRGLLALLDFEPSDWTEDEMRAIAERLHRIAAGSLAESLAAGDLHRELDNLRSEIARLARDPNPDPDEYPDELEAIIERLSA